MNIIFICGCLEPGRDGVGDYCRNLAKALVNGGHLIKLIAYKDGFVEKGIRNEIQQMEEVGIPVVRMAYRNDEFERTKIIRKLITSFEPDLISLQYVPYSYQIKGLPIFLTARLKTIGEDYRWHIMFHELYVGISKLSPLKYRIIGNFQRHIVQRLVKELKPEFITTSNLIYQAVLKRSNIQSEVLPLFSNIPKFPLNTEYKFILLKKLNLKGNYKDHYLLVGVFGTIYREASLEERLRELEKEAKFHSKKLIFISMGRSGQFGFEQISKLKKLFKNRVTFLNLGEISEIKISTVLQMLDYGISCTPFEYLSKSGVYAAMQLHGLKVITTKNNMLPEYGLEIENEFNRISLKDPHEWHVDTIAKSFLSLIQTGKENLQKIDF